MKLIDYKGESYEYVDFPLRSHIMLGRKISYSDKVNGAYVLKTRRVWRFDVIGLLFDPFDGLITGKCAWDMNLYPSWGTGFRNLWNNICVFLTPWFNARRHLLRNLYNRNDSKLLSSDRRSCSFRSRGEDVDYFYVEFGWIYGTLKRIRWVDKSGDSKNMFVSSLLGEKDLHQETRTLIHRMPVLTRRQCERFLDKAVKRTSRYLSWYLGPTEDPVT